MKNSIVLVSLLFAACTTASGDDPANTDGNAPQQVITEKGGGKGDGAGSAAKVPADPRLLNCQFEYERFSPEWATHPLGTFETAFDKVETGFQWAFDPNYTLGVVNNMSPAYNLSLNVNIWDAKTNKLLGYVVLPRPHVGGAYLFELGVAIPSIDMADGTGSFDNLRAYCSIRNPS